MSSTSLTISEIAYQGLYKLATGAQQEPIEEAFLVEDGIRHHTDPVPTKAEGVSHALNTYSWLPLEAWQDTRPPQIVRNHEALLKYTDQVRLPWWLQPLPYNPETDEPELAPTLEEQLSLLRKPRFLTLIETAKGYYSRLARLHKMETHSGRHNTGNYAAACIEAIGLGWLSLPPTYELPPNTNKLRPEFIRRKSTKSTHPWQMSKEQIEEAIANGHLGVRNY
jgi:hypothetical protein